MRKQATSKTPLGNVAITSDKNGIALISVLNRGTTAVEISGLLYEEMQQLQSFFDP
jgi:hypothetical protein